VNKELTAEVIRWEGYSVELARDEITIKGKGQALILPDYQVKNFKEFLQLLKSHPK